MSDLSADLNILVFQKLRELSNNSLAAPPVPEFKDVTFETLLQDSSQIISAIKNTTDYTRTIFPLIDRWFDGSIHRDGAFGDIVQTFSDDIPGDLPFLPRTETVTIRDLSSSYNADSSETMRIIRLVSTVSQFSESDDSEEVFI